MISSFLYNLSHPATLKLQSNDKKIFLFKKIFSILFTFSTAY